MNFDVVIIGGGLVGASLAASLKSSVMSVALVESLPISEDTDGWDSRIYAVSPGSRRFLEQVGAWSLMDAKRIAPVEAMRVFGDHGATLEFSAYQMGVSELACTLENRELQLALWKKLQQQDNLTLLHPAKCSSFRNNGESTELIMEDGRILNAKLVVGADGRNSWVRSQAGITAAPVDYQQFGVVANFSSELPHRGIAHQWFKPDSILALLPLPGNQVSMVWSTSPANSDLLLKLAHDELSSTVATAANDTLGRLRVVTAPAAFPLRMLTLPHIVAPRLALIGDAAHNMHPLAGQGVNTGFRDASMLASLLLNRGAQIDCGNPSLLRQYERKRKEDIYTMQATTYGLKQLFNNDDPLLRTLRNFGLNATNRFTPIKKMLMQHALN